MPLTTSSSLDLNSWYYNEASGLVVYFKKRFNDLYDAHDIITNKRVKPYSNLTLERIRELFKPYEKRNVVKPIAQHVTAALDTFEAEVGEIQQPSDLELHNQIKRFINTTRSDMDQYLDWWTDNELRLLLGSYT